MNATLTTYPDHCPHGAPQRRQRVAAFSVFMTYTDGCWTTRGAGSGLARLFHVDENASQSVTVANYLRDWDEALVLNAGDELYDEAENEDYHRTVEAADHAEYQAFMDAHPPRTSVGYDVTWGQDPMVIREVVPDICGWCGGLAVLDPKTNACSACRPDALDHAEHLGEVPWTDRVED